MFVYKPPHFLQIQLILPNNSHIFLILKHMY